MSNKIINIYDHSLEFTETSYNDKFKSKSVSLSALVDAQKLGYRLVKVEPGYCAWPFHNHRVNEEIFLILDGQGVVRVGKETFPVKSGDIISAIPGGAEFAHQIINNSDNMLTYLCMSTMIEPDVIEYPDSGKFGVFVGAAPGGSKEDRTFTFFGRESNAVDYWEDE